MKQLREPDGGGLTAALAGTMRWLSLLRCAVGTFQVPSPVSPTYVPCMHLNRTVAHALRRRAEDAVRSLSSQHWSPHNWPAKLRLKLWGDHEIFGPV